MTRKILQTLLFTLTLQAAWAQQDAMYSQYMFNYMAINPGYTGSRDVLSVTGLFRKQWVDIDGAPRTVTFTADAPIAKERMGIGLTFFNDKIGIENNSGVYATYAYRLRLSKKGTLGFGVSVGATQYKAALSNVNTNNPNVIDPAFSSNISEINPNVGFGAYYSTDKFYLSLSLPHIIDTKFSDLSGVQSRVRRHYFMGAGYVFTLNPSVKLKPSFLVKVVEGAPIQADFNMNLWLADRVGIGALYRTGDAWAGMLEIQLAPALRLGYAYDLTTSRLGRYNSGTHEIMLRYEFATNKKKIISPRYF